MEAHGLQVIFLHGPWTPHPLSKVEEGKREAGQGPCLPSSMVDTAYYNSAGPRPDVVLDTADALQQNR